MRTLNSDLLAAQLNGYPSSHVKQAYINLVFTHKTGTPTYSYSFEPGTTTNKLLTLRHKDGLFEESTNLWLQNNDLAVPDLKGYSLDIGYGLNTASGNQYSEVGRQWVKFQHKVERSIFSGSPGIFSVLELVGSWPVMYEQKCCIGNAPYYQDDYGMLKGKTIYECLEYLIETVLSAATDMDWFLDALTVDDGIINTLIPWPSDSEDVFINPNAEQGDYDTIGKVCEYLLGMTNCYMIPQADLHFKIIYPQKTDAVNKTFYNSLASGHAFYENTEVESPPVPSQMRVMGNMPDGDITNFIMGVAYDDQSYDESFNYIGPYMDTYDIKHASTLTSQADIEAHAKALLARSRAYTFSGRTVAPMECGIELLDKIAVISTRGS
jgi:hypothetical protein